MDMSKMTEEQLKELLLAVRAERAERYRKDSERLLREARVPKPEDYRSPDRKEAGEAS